MVKLQRALEVLGDTTGPEVDSLRLALEKATKLSSERAWEVQITECKGFVARAEKRVAQLDAQRGQEMAAHEEGRARLQRLEAEAARKQEGIPIQPPPFVPPLSDMEAEIKCLREQVVATERERDDALFAQACKRQATSRTESSARMRLREDFVPMCDEDILRWVQDRQADMQEAATAGNGHEVARLCHVLGTAATSWSTPTPSMVSNTVQR